MTFQNNVNHISSSESFRNWNGRRNKYFRKDPEVRIHCFDADDILVELGPVYTRSSENEKPLLPFECLFI